jgi:hypothetical protein
MGILENLRRVWTLLKYTHSLTLRDILEPHEGHTVPECHGVTSSHKDKPTQWEDGSDLHIGTESLDTILEEQGLLATVQDRMGSATAGWGSFLPAPFSS